MIDCHLMTVFSFSHLIIHKIQNLKTTVSIIGLIEPPCVRERERVEISKIKKSIKIHKNVNFNSIVLCSSCGSQNPSSQSLNVVLDRIVKEPRLNLNQQHIISSGFPIGNGETTDLCLE